MQKVNIKPLSVNELFKGRRFKTPKYNAYEKELLLKLKPISIPEKPYHFVCKFGVSNINADLDNLLKGFIDCLQKKYGINDKDISSMLIFKELTEKGREYIVFEIENAYFSNSNC